MASIQETIRALCGADPTIAAIVGDRIYPGEVPDNETPAPWLYYTLPETLPSDDLDGDGFIDAQVEFHVLTDTYAEAKSLIDAIKGALNAFSGGQVIRAFWRGTSEEAIEGIGYHHSARFDVHGSEALVFPAAGSSARLTTGADSITLTAGGHVLTLDSAGLELDGAIVGAAPDLSAYARKDAANTFTNGPQTIQAGAGVVGLAVKAAAIQTANLTEWQDSSGAAGAHVDKSRNFSRPGAGANSEAFGDSAGGSGANASAFGQGAQATASNSTAIGQGAWATASSSSIVGQGGKTGTGSNVFIFGNFDNSVGNYSNVVTAGLNATAIGSSAVSLGNAAMANSSAVAVGSGAAATGDSSTAVGGDASATHSGAVVLGRVAASEANGDLVLGGYGSSAKQLRLVAQSSANNSRDQARIETTWIDSTDATRTSRVIHYSTANAVKQEYMRADGNSGGPRIGFLGAAATARPTVSGSRGGNAALASLLTALATLGLITDSTTA